MQRTSGQRSSNSSDLSIDKDKWINKERLRWAKVFSVPMAEGSPPGFPQFTLTVMRAMCAITVLYPGVEGQKVLIKCLERLFRAAWVEHQKTQEKEVLEELLTSVLGPDETAKGSGPRSLKPVLILLFTNFKSVLKMVPEEGKETLTKNTDKAFEDGAFGLPWFVATNSKGEKDTFWGVDHLAQVTAHLGLETPRTGGWKALL